VVLVLLAASWGLGKYLDAAASRAEARATAAEQALTDQKAQNAQFAATVGQLTQQYQQLTASLAAQNASLAASMATRQTAQVAQRATDAHLPLTELVTRLSAIGNVPLDDISVVGNQISLNQPGAVAVTQTLESIPALQGDLKDTTATLGATQAAKAQADTLIAGQAKEITGLNLQITDADKACKAQVSAVTADANKSKRKWFLRGVLVGFLGGLWGGHAGL
jgi:chromosome segregation ATPase